MLLTLAFLAAQAAAAPEIERARAVIREATRAVDRDGVERAQMRWSRAPRADRGAQLGLATLARLTYRHADADRRYSALARPDSAIDAFAVYALLGHGGSYVERSAFEAAESPFRRALAGAHALRDPLAEAEALLGLAAVGSRTSRADSAVRLVERATALLHPGSPTADVARARCSLAAVLRTTAAQRADSLVESALVLARSSGDARVLGRCLIVRARVSEVRGNQRASRQAIASAVEVLRGTRDRLTLAQALQFSAYAAASYSLNFLIGRHHAQEAVALARALGDAGIEAWASLNLAQIALRVGDAAAARRHTVSARAIFARTGDRTGSASTEIVEANASLAAGQLVQARRAFEHAYALQDSLGWRTNQPYVLFGLATVARTAGDVREAEQQLDRALEMARSLGLRGYNTDVAYARGVLAMMRGDYADATTELSAYSRQMGAASPHFRLEAELRLAETHARAGNLDRAERSLDTAFADLDYVRRHLTERDGAVAALQSRRFDVDRDLGIATTIHLLARGGRIETAFRAAEAQRARFLWTQLVRRWALATDSGTVDPRRVSRLLSDEPRAATILSALPESTAFVLYETGGGGEPTTVFVLSRERGLQARWLPPADSLAPSIERFATALEGGLLGRALARRLGADLLDSVLDALPSNVSKLVISPDGPLHRLPFDALLMRDGRHIVERYATSIAPSARIALAGWMRSAGSGGTRAVVVGDPRIDPALELPPLPASRDEARSVARLAREPLLLLGAQATEAALRRTDWSSVGLLHLATHARVEDNGLFTSALYFGAGDGDDGRLGVEEISTLSLKADLVVLSACRTLGGVIVTGEGLQGLTAPFLEAGARAVVATYWPIGDRSILPFVASFYDGLRVGLAAGAALRRAKLDALGREASPAVWASFALTGDASARPRLR